MANELTTAVPAKARDVKGFERLLTQEDIALVVDKPVRWVRERLLVTGVIRSVRFGEASYRVRPEVFRAWLDKGCPGFSRKI